LRILLVDDDPGLRTLLRTTFEVADVEMDEAESAAAARDRIDEHHPDVVVLDVRMPGMDGLEFCHELKADAKTRDIPVVLLTGADEQTAADATAAGADAFLAKPFSPLELLSVAERLAGGMHGIPFRTAKTGRKPQGDEELLLYARDLRHLLELERGQRVLLEQAYHQTVTALATALEAKDTGTRAHSQRVQLYALELTRTIDPELAANRSAEYGFLLHDAGKMGIPDSILLKPAPLTAPERRRMQTHTVLGEQMLGGIGLLKGEGLRIVRSHHERWDGRGYPDRLRRDEIPLGARIFAVADSLDAMTSDRPYRRAVSWASARGEILGEAGKQFDPDVVGAFVDSEAALLEIQREHAAA
jgi:response regulator RpfG family c-di-GMP phosphodiesterase